MVFLLIVSIVVLLLQTDYSRLDASLDPKDSLSRTILFACELSSSKDFYCQPSVTRLKAYSERAISDVIYSLATREATYTNGEKEKALYVTPSHLAEFFQVPNDTGLSSDQFSISFWVRASEAYPDY